MSWSKQGLEPAVPAISDRLVAVPEQAVMDEQEAAFGTLCGHAVDGALRRIDGRDQPGNDPAVLDFQPVQCAVVIRHLGNAQVAVEVANQVVEARRARSCHGMPCPCNTESSCRDRITGGA